MDGGRYVISLRQGATNRVGKWFKLLYWPGDCGGFNDNNWNARWTEKGWVPLWERIARVVKIGEIYVYYTVFCVIFIKCTLPDNRPLQNQKRNNSTRWEDEEEEEEKKRNVYHKINTNIRTYTYVTCTSLTVVRSPF